MKKRILLLDESLTVQKVVALTLDRERFTITNVKTRSEAMKLVLESPPDLILVSDQVAGISASAFPKEVETWAGRDRKVPPLILITNQDAKEQRGYRQVLKKPFAPQALQSIVTEVLSDSDAEPSYTDSNDTEDSQMLKVFSETFSDEAQLVDETFKMEVDEAEETVLSIPVASKSPAKSTPRRTGPPPVENVAELWGRASDSDEKTGEVVQVLGAEDSMAYKAQLEQEVRHQLEGYDLEDVVNRLLERMVPPIVERLAQARLDQLLKETEGFVELKP